MKMANHLQLDLHLFTRIVAGVYLMSEWSKQAAKRFLEQEKTKKKQEQEENDREAALI